MSDAMAPFGVPSKPPSPAIAKPAAPPVPAIAASPMAPNGASNGHPNAPRVAPDSADMNPNSPMAPISVTVNPPAPLTSPLSGDIDMAGFNLNNVVDINGQDQEGANGSIWLKGWYPGMAGQYLGMYFGQQFGVYVQNGPAYLTIRGDSGTTINSDVVINGAITTVNGSFQVGTGSAPFRVDNVNRAVTIYARLLLTALPVSPSGLPSGTVWNNGGVLNVVP